MDAAAWFAAQSFHQEKPARTMDAILANMEEEQANAERAISRLRELQAELDAWRHGQQGRERNHE